MRRVFVVVVGLSACAGGLGDNGDGTFGLGDSTGGGTTMGAPVGTSTGADETAEPPGTATSAGSTSGASETTGGPDACARPWRVQRDTGVLTDLVLDETSGTVHAVGALTTGEGWAMAIDACDGTVLADTTVTHAAADTTRLDSLVLDGGALFAAGAVTTADDPRNGLYVRLDPADMSTLWTAPLYGSVDQDSVLDVAVTASGRVWMAGISREDTMPTTWMVSGDADGSACGFAWNGLGSGQARAITAMDDTAIVAARTTAGELVLLRYDAACTCMCTADWESPPIEVGLADTSPADIIEIGGQYYVAGYANDGGTLEGLYPFLVWVSSMGTVIETYAVDPSANGDGYFFVGADDDRFYVGGGRDWMGADGFTDANALIQALPQPLGPGTVPDWEATPTEVDYVQSIGIEAGAEGQLYVGGNVDAAGVIVRCDKQGVCG